MKTLKVKFAAINIVAVICTLSLMQGSAFGQTVASTATPASIQVEKSDVKALIGSLKFERERLSTLKKKYKADKTEGREMAALEDEKQITRAEGDLKMAKAYLQAEKTMFIESYNLAIRSRRDAVRTDRSKLADAKIKLSKDIDAGNETADKDALAVVRYEKDLTKDKESLSREKINKDNDILALNKDIKKYNGQFVGSLYAENAILSTGKLLEK